MKKESGEIRYASLFIPPLAYYFTTTIFFVRTPSVVCSFFGGNPKGENDDHSI